MMGKNIFRLAALTVLGLLSAALVQSPLAGPADSRSLRRDFSLPLPLFSADSAWNQKCVNARVLVDSDQQMLVAYRVMRGDTSTIRPRDIEPVN